MEELDDFEHQYDSNLDALDQLQSGGAGKLSSSQQCW